MVPPHTTPIGTEYCSTTTAAALLLLLPQHTQIGYFVLTTEHKLLTKRKPMNRIQELIMNRIHASEHTELKKCKRNKYLPTPHDKE